MIPKSSDYAERNRCGHLFVKKETIREMKKGKCERNLNESHTERSQEYAPRITKEEIKGQKTRSGRGVRMMSMNERKSGGRGERRRGRSERNE